MMRIVFSLVLVGMVSAGLFAADSPTKSKVTAEVLNQETTSTDETALTLDDLVRTALAKNPAVQSAAAA